VSEIISRFHRTLGIALAMIVISLAGRCEGAAPYLVVESFNGTSFVTWTNAPEFHLLESTNLVDWVPSTRAFIYLGSYHRVWIRSTEARRFYRLTGASAAELRLGWESEHDRLFIRWPYPAEDAVLQTRSEVHEGEWALVDEAVVVFGGYKRLQVPDDGATWYYRLSRPLNHVLIVGQSLAVGVGGYQVLSTTQPYANKMFINQQLDGAYLPLLPDDLSELVPLVEGTDRFYTTGETIASGFANSISFWDGPGQHDLLVSNAGRSASGYEQLKRGTAPYTRGTNQIAGGKAVAQYLGYRFQAIFAVHGEGDSINQNYDLNIREWQRDFTEDVSRQTGQSWDVPMFHSQIASFGGMTLSPYLTLAEHEANPAKTVLVGPKYFLPYNDPLHLNSVGYQWLGEYYAKAYRQHVIQGVPWSPLRPIDIVRTNEFITVTFTGNVGSLVWDTNLVTNPQGTFYLPVYGPSVFVVIDPVQDTVTFPTTHQLQPGDPLFFHGVTAPGGIALDGLTTRYFVRSIPQSNSVTVATSTNGPIVDFTSTGTNVFTYLPKQVVIGPYGFEYFEDAGSGIPWRCATEIVSAEIISTNQVRLRLSQIPTAGYRRLSYAYTATEFTSAGPTTGRRGNLRDSDPATSLYGRTLYNWCVHFDKPVP
jgi:hypothetical protein